MNKGIKGRLAAFPGLQVAALAADTLSDAVDSAGLNSLGWLVSVAAFAFTSVNKIGLELVHSDDNVTYVAADLSDYEGGSIKELLTAADGGKVHAVGYVGTKRYVKLNLNVSGIVSVNVSAIALSTAPLAAPAI